MKIPISVNKKLWRTLPTHVYSLYHMWCLIPSSISGFLMAVLSYTHAHSFAEQMTSLESLFISRAKSQESLA